MKHRAAERAIHLTPSHDAHELDAIAFREFPGWPFALMKRNRVVLDQHTVRLQTVMFRQLSDIR
jgi:hypothetical protein